MTDDDLVSYLEAERLGAPDLDPAELVRRLERERIGLPARRRTPPVAPAATVTRLDHHHVRRTA